MKYFFTTIIKYITKFFLGIWDFIFFFFGMPYEEQAKRLKVDRIDMRGPKNEKTKHTSYRANKVSKKAEK